MGQNQSIEKHSESTDNSGKQNNTTISKPISNLLSQLNEKPTKRHQPLPRKSNELNEKGAYICISTQMSILFAFSQKHENITYLVQVHIYTIATHCNVFYLLECNFTVTDMVH